MPVKFPPPVGQLLFQSPAKYPRPLIPEGTGGTTGTTNLEWQPSVIDCELTAPPAFPSVGDRYVVAAVATGAWTGQEDDIAEWDGSSWVFTTPEVNWALLCESTNEILIWNGTEWIVLMAAMDHGSLVGLGDDDHLQYLLEDGSRPLSGNLDLGGNRIVLVDTPVNGTDAANKAYVDAQIGTRWVEDEFTASGGQITFILSQAPLFHS